MEKSKIKGKKIAVKIIYAMQELVSVKNFSKAFNHHAVIRNLSFSVNQGEIFAFLGANGSGKTTTLHCLLGIYQADEGELTIQAQKFSPQISNLVGYLPEERGLYNNNRVLETFIYFGQLKGMSAMEAKNAAQAFLASVGLEDKAQVQIKKLSSGQQQKVQLGLTVINNPPLLILDEPTKGLDPVNRHLLLKLLLDLNAQGTTIIFSTHLLDEVEEIAQRLLLIKNGTAMLYGDLQEVKKQFGENIIRLKYSGHKVNAPKLFSGEWQLNTATLVPHKGVAAETILQYLLSQQLKILSFDVGYYSLQEIFLLVNS